MGPVKQRGLFQEIARRIAFNGTDAIRNKDGDMDPRELYRAANCRLRCRSLVQCAPPRIRHLLLEFRDQPIRLLRWAFRTAVTPFTCNRDDITKAYPKNDGLMLGKVLVFLSTVRKVFLTGEI